MKPSPFDYARPATVPEAVALLAETGDDAKVLAGGQSLVPVLAMRLGRPALLVDINAVAGLDALSLSGDTLHVGATVRQRQVERDPLTAAVPLLVWPSRGSATANFAAGAPSAAASPTPTPPPNSPPSPPASTPPWKSQVRVADARSMPRTSSRAR